MDTVQQIFYERIVRSVSARFFDLVAISIKVELGLKNAKMINADGIFNYNNPKKFPINLQKKKEGKMNDGSSSRGRIQSWRKKQRQFTQQQPTYLVHYVQ